MSAPAAPPPSGHAFHRARAREARAAAEAALNRGDAVEFATQRLLARLEDRVAGRAFEERKGRS